jgi:hypothetical protein
MSIHYSGCSKSEKWQIPTLVHCCIVVEIFDRKHRFMSVRLILQKLVGPIVCGVLHSATNKPAVLLPRSRKIARLHYMQQGYKILRLLKYGFCKKLLWYKWTSDQLNTFFLTFRPDQCWSVLFRPKSEEKSVQLVRGSFVPKLLLTKSILYEEFLDWIAKPMRKSKVVEKVTKGLLRNNKLNSTRVMENKIQNVLMHFYK